MPSDKKHSPSYCTPPSLVVLAEIIHRGKYLLRGII